MFAMSPNLVKTPRFYENLSEVLTPPFSHQISHSKLLHAFSTVIKSKDETRFQAFCCTSTSTTPQKTFNKVAYFSKTCYPPFQDPTLG